MPKGYKKRNIKTHNEKNLKKHSHNNRSMYDELMSNVQKYRNYQNFNTYVPPSESQYETQSENTEDIITPGGSKEPRVIKRMSLYRNTEEEPNACNPPQTSALGNSSSLSYCQRTSDTETHLPQSHRQPLSKRTCRKQPQVQKNKVEKTLHKMLSKPVEMSKGKSLLEKMGWTGGGLGKNGNGIVNPIEPKATYAVNTLGLGHNSETEQEQKKPRHREAYKLNHNFHTNVLLKILEFVKNNSEADLIFEHSLYNKERKKIHGMVEALRNCTAVDELDYVKPLDIEIASEILSCNTYILQTASFGKRSARSLRIYKDAPSHVYLIKPNDLRDDDDKEFNDFCDALEINTKGKTGNKIETFTKKVKHLEVEKDETRNDEQDHNNINLNSSTEGTTITREDLKTKNDDRNLNHDLSLEKISDSKKFVEVDNSATNVNCQLDSELNSKNDNPNLNHKLSVEKVTYSKKNTEIDNFTSNVNSQLNTKQHSKTESLECSLVSDKTIEKVLEVENQQKSNPNSNKTIEQDVRNTENENPENELNDRSEQKSDKSLLSVIVDYFKEFIVDTSYLELRFLGPFNSEEVDAINTFFDICLKRDKEDSIEKIEILEALNNAVYDIEIKEDLDGSNVVYKREKCLQEMAAQ